MSLDPDKPGRSQVRADGVGTTSLALDTAESPQATEAIYVKAIQYSGDLAAVVSVVSDPGGTPDTLWTKRYAAAFADSQEFPIPLKGGAGKEVRLSISVGTANTEGALQGYIDAA